MIIGLVGKAGSGKNLVAEMIREMVPMTREISFAEPMKKFVQEIFDFTDAQVYGASAQRNKEDKRYHRWSDEGPQDGPEFLTPRYALQTLGTEWGRDCYEDLWVEYGMRRAHELLDGIRIRNKSAASAFGTSGQGSFVIDRCRLVVITDVRFLNEMDAIDADQMGVVWEIQRDAAGLKGQAGDHASEADIGSEDSQDYIAYHINNNGTIEELRHQVMVGLAEIGMV